MRADERRSRSAPEPTEAVFQALSDPTRRRVIAHLSASEDATATGLAQEIPVTRQAIAKHLSALEEAGLVSGEKVGRERRYRLTPSPLAEAVSWITSIRAPTAEPPAGRDTSTKRARG